MKRFFFSNLNILLFLALITDFSKSKSFASPGESPCDVAIKQLQQSCLDCNLVVVSIDTMRADHLGCYGYNRNTSPNIDKLAKSSILFKHAYSTSFLTAESHMSMFASLYPSVHKIRNAQPEERVAHRLHPSIRTFPELLRENGYRTAAITGGGNVSAVYGFDRGMDLYEVCNHPKDGVNSVIRFINQNINTRFFAFFHTYHVHDPYTPAPPFDSLYYVGYKGKIISNLQELSQFQMDYTFNEHRSVYWSFVNKNDPEDIAYLTALYDGEVNEVDIQLGRLFRTIRRKAPNTIIVVTSDHGEEFGDHGDFLHNHLYQELLHVPLILSLPWAKKAVVIEDSVSHISLAPTLLDFLDIPPLIQFQGKSIKQIVVGEEVEQTIFAEKEFHGAALISDDYKIIIRYKDKADKIKEIELYDLVTDPGEKINLAGSSHKTGFMLSLLKIQQEQNREHRRFICDDQIKYNPSYPMNLQTQQQLKSLGYIE